MKNKKEPLSTGRSVHSVRDYSRRAALQQLFAK